MLKNKFYVIFFLLFSFPSKALYAERTGGFCGMSEDLKGKEVLALYPGVYFYCLEASAIKNQVWIDAWVKTTEIYDGIRLVEKTKLYSENLKIIGKVSLSFNPMKVLEEKDSMTHLVVSGYLEKACSDNTFLPEEELSKLLDKAENNEKLDYFLPFLGKFNFQGQSESTHYKSYLLVQPDFVRQTLFPRILLVFNQNELIAIFHTRAVRVKKYDSIEMGSQYKMIYNSKFSEHTKKEMVEIYKKKISQ